MRPIERTEERAMEVYALSRLGMTKSAIARYLGVHRTQVVRDFTRAKKLIRWTAENIDGQYHLGETLEAFQKQEANALANAAALDPSSAVAVAWMKLALDARKKIMELLQESGFVFKMPEVMEAGLPFDDPEARKEYLEFRARLKVIARGKEKSSE